MVACVADNSLCALWSVRTRKRQSDERPSVGLTSSSPKKSQVAYQLRLTHDRTYLEYKYTIYQFLGLCWRRFDFNFHFRRGQGLFTDQFWGWLFLRSPAYSRDECCLFFRQRSHEFAGACQFWTDTPFTPKLKHVLKFFFVKKSFFFVETT